MSLARWQQSRQACWLYKIKIKNTSILYYCYVLNSIKRNYIYVGLTNNATRRFEQHQKGRERTTAPYRPFQIILIEKYLTRPEARNREKYLKSGIGKEWIKRYFLK